MNRQRIAGAITGVCIFAAVAALVTGRATLAHSPEDAVCLMLDAAREGDVGAYVESFSGALRNTVRNAVSEQGEPQYAQFLKNIMQPLRASPSRKRT